MGRVLPSPEDPELEREADAFYLPEHLAELVAAAMPPNEFEAPLGWGLYAWFLKGASHLESFPVGPHGLIYIGKSKDLSRRDVKQHLSDDGTPSSTFRRSLGAILSRALPLKARPRSKSLHDAKRFTNFAFDVHGEKLLSKWIFENLFIGAAIRDDPDTYEPLLIRQYKPLLNLVGWKNPYSPTIKALRKRCAQEARNHAE